MNILNSLFNKIKEKNINIIYLILIGFSFGAINGFFQFVLKAKHQMNLLQSNDRKFMIYLFILYVVVIPVLTLLIRALIAWIIGKIIGFAEYKRVLEIIFICYISCLSSLFPVVGGILEFVLNGILIFIAFKSYFQIKNWKVITYSLVISLVIISSFDYIVL